MSIIQFMYRKRHSRFSFHWIFLVFLIELGRCLVPRQHLHAVVLFALSQRLVESLTQAEVRLPLCTLDKVLDLPCTRTLLLLLSVGRLLTVGRLLLLDRGCFTAATSATEHSCESGSRYVTYGRTDRHASSRGRHLLHKAGLLRGHSAPHHGLAGWRLSR